MHLVIQYAASKTQWGGLAGRRPAIGTAGRRKKRTNKKMATLERTFTLDRDLARRADRKMRRYGLSMDDAVEYVFMLVVETHGRPDFAAPPALDFSVDGTPMRKRRGVALPMETGVEDGMHTARADKIGLDAFAATRDELAAEIRDQLAMLWKEYALADDAELTKSARVVKRNLLATFEEAHNA